MVIFQFAMLNCQRVNINQSKPKVFLKVSTWQYDQTGYFFQAPYPSQLERKNSTAKRSIFVVRMYHMDPYGLNFRAIFQAICPKFSQEYGFIYFFWRFLYLQVRNLQNYWVSQGLQCLPRLPRVQGFLVRLLRGAEGGDGWWDLDVATKAAEQWPVGTGFGMVCLVMVDTP